MITPRDQETKNFAAFLKAYYKNGTMHPGDAERFTGKLATVQKADNPLSYNNSTTWFDPVYLNNIMYERMTHGQRSIFGAIKKTTFQELGDSIKKISDDNLPGMGPLLENGQLYTNTGLPDIERVDKIVPVYFKVDWTISEIAAEMNKLPGRANDGTPTLEQVRTYVTDRFFDRVEQQLAGTYVDFSLGGNGTNQGGYGIDAPATFATDGGATGIFESLDRMISCSAEMADDGATTPAALYTSDTSDGNIYWNQTGTGTPRYNRANPNDEAQSQVRLPDPANITTGEDYNILDELDNLMAEALTECQESNPDYVMFMSPKAYNRIKTDEDAKRIIDTFPTARQTINGVTSAPGGIGGKVQFSALRVADITVPVVISNYLMGTKKSGWKWKNTKHTTGGVGNIYCVNQNAMEFRTLIPLSYRMVQAEDYLKTKHTIYMAGQLISYKWGTNAALKYIASA